MISIKQLKETLNNTKFKKIVLPNFGIYCQIGYQELKSDKNKYEEILKQQQDIKNAVESGIEINVIKTENINDFGKLVKKEDKGNYRITNIKYSSYLNYTENSTFDLPEDLQLILKDQINKTVKIYGLKNPNSFIKSIILLNDPNYMVFNRYQMNQAVFKWRTDLAYYYKNNKKDFSKLPRADLSNIETLILRDNFYNSVVVQLSASYTGKNIIVLDYINKQYEIFLADMKEHYLDDVNNLVNNCLKQRLDFYLIIKYQDCYMPCLKIDNNNYFKLIDSFKDLELANMKYYFNNIFNIEETNKCINKQTKMLSSVVDISKLKRDTMQRIAISYDIDIMKPGSKPGSKIKKTKQDLYNDFKLVVYDINKMSVDEF
jgi:hypothetical protein